MKRLYMNLKFISILILFTAITTLLLSASGCRMFVPEKDTAAEYELSPEIFFADPGKPVMSAKGIAYSKQQGALRAWLDNLKIPAVWRINGGINRKSLPLTLDFSGKRLGTVAKFII